MRVYFNAWGAKIGELRLAEYAMRRPGESPSEAVARSIARTTGLAWCGRVRSEGYGLTRGVVDSAHYAGTVGEPCSGGGWTPVAEIWFSIPITDDERGNQIVLERIERSGGV